MKIFFYTLRPYDELLAAEKISRQMGIEFDYTEDYPDSENYMLADGCESICVTPCDMSAPILEKFASIGVKYIICRSVGYDHVDLAKARELGMRVANVEYPPSGVANYAVMLMMMCERNITQILRRADIQDFTLKGKIGHDISFETVGVVGTGKIGTAVLKALSGFGCRLLCSDPYKNEEAAKYAEYA